MAILAIGLRLVLAIVFALAAMAKLRDRSSLARTLPAYGAPAWAVAPLTTAIPVFELVAAGLLLWEATVASGAALALLLLLAFSATIGVALARGQAPDCACFGAATVEPIGSHTLWRNATLIAMATIVWVGAALAPSSASSLRATQIADSMFALITVGFAVGLLLAMRETARWRVTNRALRARLVTLEAQSRAQPAQPTSQDGLDPGGLPVGIPAPPFDLPRLEGDRTSLASLLAGGRSVALVFSSAHCPACHQLWPEIERWQRQRVGEFEVAVICSGSPQTLELKLMGHDVGNVLLEQGTIVADAYALSLRPSVVVVGPDGAISTRSVAGVHAIRALLDGLPSNPGTTGPTTASGA